MVNKTKREAEAGTGTGTEAGQGINFYHLAEAALNRQQNY